MARQKKVHHAEVYGWAGTGESVSEAKKDAIAKITKAGDGHYTPVGIRYKDMLGIAWREPGGWWYKIVRPTSLMDGDGMGYGCCGVDDSEDEVKRSMIRHLCQNGFDAGDDPEPPKFMTNEEDRKEHKRWASWQNAYSVHKKANPQASDEECRAAADVSAFGYTLQPR